MSENFDVAIVGAGLSALSALREGTPGARVIVLEHRSSPGGALLPLLAEPEFEAARKVVQQRKLPEEIEFRFNATAVGLLPAFAARQPHTLLVRQRQGTVQIEARKIIIATGGLEMTREHQRIPGTRPVGVMTPALALQFLERGYLPGRQAIVYGDSCYANVTARRLRAAGVEICSFVPSTGDNATSDEAAELLEVHGFPRLTDVRLRTRKREFEQPADALIYAAGMLANTHWLKGSGLETGADGTILVDRQFRTNIPGIYAIGTVVSPSLDHARSRVMGKEVAEQIQGGQA